ncbi:hypothetical protein J4734_23855 [Klebsiella pneumoniae]|uniref:Uncharacterized protein n=1 Tax=Klebsiella pneumoniae TaxID=573 RepID=A0A939SUQ6_KLEPN|nr:hypothetical protein [Klebsiella pneumoniae]
MTDHAAAFYLDEVNRLKIIQDVVDRLTTPMAAQRLVFPTADAFVALP